MMYGSGYHMGWRGNAARFARGEIGETGFRDRQAVLGGKRP